jgi:transcriptional regulator with PAS, ATPase and Fis domain
MRTRLDDILGKAECMQRVYDHVIKIAPLSINVLILGETGTGKELVARAIHAHSSRAYQSFIKVDCTAIPETLLESELFGYKKGAFTDARFDKPGKFELADKGTVFLDEIGELPLSVQAKLLRVLEDNVFEPLGGVKSVRVDVRIIAATNRDLQQSTRTGHFRRDLYYRLNVFPITMPELQERLEDIPLLVEHFIGTCNQQYGKRIRGLHHTVEDIFVTYPWPGNVRQLRHAIEFACINSSGQHIRLVDLPDDLRAYASPRDDREVIGNPFEQAEYQILTKYLRANAHDRNRTAHALHMSRVTLWRKMKKYGLC